MPGASLTFRPRHRLTHERQFQAVYGARLQKSAGPLTLHARPNDLPHPRLGLSVGRRVGAAVARNRVKRLIREAFRHLQHELPRWERGEASGAYDYIVSVRASEPLEATDYQRLLADLSARVHSLHERRAS